MQCEVIVVGAGIGGLTTAALLAARGVDVCVFERQPYVGGCVANFEHLGYVFEPTFGLYAGWGADGTWERIFAGLPVSAPDVRKLSPSYVVRLPDGREVSISADYVVLEDLVARAFPECADAAVRFLRELLTKKDNGAKASAELLKGTSQHFRSFIDAQLQTFAQCTSENCSSAQAAAALEFASGDFWAIDGGAQALIDRLANSFKISGGSLRLNSPVLRLAYDSNGSPVGIDLLNGERVTAKRAIISNLTIWDTYGKLIGPTRTPREVALELKQLSSWGAYLIFMGLDRTAIDRLPSPRTLLVYDLASDDYDPEQQQLLLNLQFKSRAPKGKHSLTGVAFTRAQEWFSYHEDQAWHEEQDQTLLELWWKKMHEALPELGDSIEIIETNTPHNLYETTRRKLGMIGKPTGRVGPTVVNTLFPNMYLVGDTASQGLGFEGIAQSALTLVDQITR